MTALPIVERELRVAARRKSTVWARFVVALVTVALGLLVVGTGSGASSLAEQAQAVFVCISVVALIFCGLAGVFLTADCLSSEKADGTLGLLFLTDLRGYDVVLGKLAASSVVCVYALLAMVPMMGLPMLMGGVGLGEFLRMTLALGGILAFSLSAGMLASAVGRDTRAAMVWTLLAIVGPTAGLGMAAFVTSMFITGDDRAIEWILVPSPICGFALSFQDNFASRPHYAIQYWSSVGGQWMAALAALALACRLLPRRWQEQPRSELSARPVPAGRRQTEVATRERNPFLWLARRPGGGRWWRTLPPGLLALLWLACFGGSFLAGNRWDDELYALSLLFAAGLGLLLKLMAAIEAGFRFTEDRRSGALELLLATPLETGAILRGQARVLWERLRPWLCVGTFIALALLASVVAGRPVHFSRGTGMLACVIACGALVTMWTDHFALGWVGMALGLRGWRHPRVILATLGSVVFPPWALLVGFLFVAEGLNLSEVNVSWCLAVWSAGCAFYGIITMLWHRTRLRKSFRPLAVGESVHAPPVACR